MDAGLNSHVEGGTAVGCKDRDALIVFEDAEKD